MSKFNLQAEKYILGELTGDELEGFLKTLKENTDLQKEVEELEKGNSDFIYDKKAQAVLAQIKSSNNKPVIKHRNKLYWQLSFSFGIFIVVVFLGRNLILPPYPQNISDTFENNRIKGLPAIILHKRVNNVVQLIETNIISANDILQISYRRAGMKYGAIFSIDGAGKLTMLFPESGQSSSPLESGKNSLSFAYQLDDAPDFERFFFISSKKKFLLKPIIAEAIRLASDYKNAKTQDLHLPENLSQSSRLLLKEKQ